GNFLCTFAGIFRIMFQPGHGSFLDTGLSFHYDGFSYDILWHKELVVLEAYQDRFFITVPFQMDKTTFFLADPDYFTLDLAGVSRIRTKTAGKFGHADRIVLCDFFTVFYSGFCRRDIC